MPESSAQKTCQARSAKATVSDVGAAITFTTRDDEEITIVMDRRTLLLLQHQLDHALMPGGVSSEQP